MAITISAVQFNIPNNIKYFDNGESLPDVEFVIPGMNDSLHLHRRVLCMNSATLMSLFSGKANSHCALNAKEHTIKWLDERTTSNIPYRNALMKWLRFCYGENQTFAPHECPAALALLCQLQLSCGEEVKAIIEKNMIEKAQKNLILGATMLVECATTYCECHSDETNRIDLDLARIVLSPKSMKKNKKIVLK